MISSLQKFDAKKGAPKKLPVPKVKLIGNLKNYIIEMLANVVEMLANVITSHSKFQLNCTRHFWVMNLQKLA